nr:VWA domain-containing protein [Lysobacter oculi]
MAMRQALYAPMPPVVMPQPANTEHYERPDDNPVRRASETPLSTFSIDVDTGSYSNVRRMLATGVRPPADAVRAEEFINYFHYGHPAPATRDVPFRVSTEFAPSPFNANRQLLMVGIKGYEVPRTTLPASNLVFLIDTSGSMMDEDKLPLVKTALRKLVPQMRASDRVSIVAYAGSAGLVLPPTPGDRHDEILAALDRLEAGGSTNGGDGIQLAYRVAREAYRQGGVNRVLLLTDGDFNVGVVDRKALETLVADQRKSGIALSTLGFGTGNYNDAMAERLADVGNGNHAYIDSVREAEKVLVRDMQSTLFTIASDVKIQVEFNPAVVAEYRLVGYENRALRDEDFDNDAVDAGEIGAGHEVTALYEVALVGSGGERLPRLRYGAAAGAKANGSEVALLKLRYKLPGGTQSRLIERPIARASLKPNASPDLRFAASVAGFADLLRGGKNIEGWDARRLRNLASTGIGADRNGDRAEFIDLIDRAARLVRGGNADGHND